MAIRTYCLSVPGSRRHMVSKAMLNTLGFPYEFITGHSLTDGPVKECLGMTHFAYYPKYFKLKATTASLACRRGMLDMMRKIYQDGNEWALAIQDDVYLEDNWPTLAQEYIAKLPPEIGMIAIYDRRRCYTDPRSLPSGFKINSDAVGCTEPGQLVRLDYVKRNIEALENVDCESDWALQIFAGTNKWWVIAPTPFAWQRHIGSTIEAPLPHVISPYLS